MAAPPVRQESDLIGRHGDGGGAAAVSTPHSHTNTTKDVTGGGEKACSFRSNYADQVRNGVFSASLPASLFAFSLPLH